MAKHLLVTGSAKELGGQVVLHVALALSEKYPLGQTSTQRRVVGSAKKGHQQAATQFSLLAMPNDPGRQTSMQM